MSRANEPAYPRDITRKYPDTSAYTDREQGLTVRERFASMAMWSPRNPHNSMDHEAAAHWAGIEADALIAELSKDKP